ncbi:MAG TPA: hypothetical protein V6D48_04085, partial [Oculatellaceae cyanobacterium]
QSTTSSKLTHRRFVECASLDASGGGQVQEAKNQKKFVSAWRTIYQTAVRRTVVLKPRCLWRRSIGVVRNIVSEPGKSR